VAFVIVVIVANAGRLMELRPLTGPLSIPKMIHMSIWSSGGMMLTGETEEL
jgi:hypothetical protein